MNVHQVSDLQGQLRLGSSTYLEFLRVPSLSMGLYELAAGSQDTQQPHGEDEIYYVVSGHAMIRIAAENHAIRAGSIIFVAAHVVHFFHSIGEDLSILVFFAPAES